MLMVGLLYYMISLVDPEVAKVPVWRTDGLIITILLHVGPIEFIYYWLHRALHHHYLYTRYHSHHHSSIVTEPITGRFTFYLFVFIKICSYILSSLSPQYVLFYIKI